MAAINQAHAEQTAAQRRQRCVLRIHGVKARTGLGRSKIYELMKEGRFPKARRIAGAHAVGWDSLEIDAWVDEQLDVVA